MKLDKLTEIAKAATHSRLTKLKESGYSIPENIKDMLCLEVRFEREYRIFELIVPGETPQDTKVLTSVKGHVDTMELGEVFVSLELLDKTDL